MLTPLAGTTMLGNWEVTCIKDGPEPPNRHFKNVHTLAEDSSPKVRGAFNNSLATVWQRRYYLKTELYTYMYKYEVGPYCFVSPATVAASFVLLFSRNVSGCARKTTTTKPLHTLGLNMELNAGATIKIQVTFLQLLLMAPLGSVPTPTQTRMFYACGSREWMLQYRYTGTSETHCDDLWEN